MACSDSCEGSGCRMTDKEIQARRENLLTPYEDFDTFGEWVEKYWMRNNPPKELDQAIATLGLGGETGEVLEKLKKEFRDGTLAREAALAALGDVVLYVITIARAYGYKPSDILKATYDELESQTVRGHPERKWRDDAY